MSSVAASTAVSTVSSPLSINSLLTSLSMPDEQAAQQTAILAQTLGKYCRPIGMNQVWDKDMHARIKSGTLSLLDCFKIICRLRVSLLRFYHSFDDQSAVDEIMTNRYSMLFVPRTWPDDQPSPYEVRVTWRKDIDLRLYHFFPFNADELHALSPFFRAVGTQFGGPLAKSLLPSRGDVVQVRQAGSVLEKLASSMWFNHARGNYLTVRSWLSNGKYDMFKGVQTQKEADALCARIIGTA